MSASKQGSGNAGDGGNSNNSNNNSNSANTNTLNLEFENAPIPWEYLNEAIPVPQIKSFLSQAGQHGWELVQIMIGAAHQGSGALLTGAQPMPAFVVFMKRPLIATRAMVSEVRAGEEGNGVLRN